MLGCWGSARLKHPVVLKQCTVRGQESTDVPSPSVYQAWPSWAFILSFCHFTLSYEPAFLSLSTSGLLHVPLTLPSTMSQPGAPAPWEPRPTLPTLTWGLALCLGVVFTAPRDFLVLSVGRDLLFSCCDSTWHTGGMRSSFVTEWIWDPA